MKMVYSNENSFIVNNMKNLIEGNEIEVFIKNEFAQGAVGEISAFDAWPELWVTHDADFEQVIKLIEASQHDSKASDWLCKNCNEKNDASFEVCWKCQCANE